MCLAQLGVETRHPTDTEHGSARGRGWGAEVSVLQESAQQGRSLEKHIQYFTECKARQALLAYRATRKVEQPSHPDGGQAMRAGRLLRPSSVYVHQKGRGRETDLSDREQRLEHVQ